MDVNELIRKYAKEIERIVAHGTAGDYTWNGLLFSFLRDVETAETPVYKVKIDGDNVDADAVRQFTEKYGWGSKDDEENKYYDVRVRDCIGWYTAQRRLYFDAANKVAADCRSRGVDDVEVVPHKPRENKYEA